MSDGGKGSAPRPISVSNQEYAERWDAIFAKKEKTDQEAIKLVPQTLKQSIEEYENRDKAED